MKTTNLYIDTKQLRKRCRDSFLGYAGEGELVETTKGRYIFQDNGASILAVAHLDTVLNDPFFCTTREQGHKVVYSPNLDDRLGAYILLDVLPTLGLKYDILLTDEEERCNSTARLFVPPKGRKYNWMFQFDRRGADVVLYQYGNRKTENLLRNAGFPIGQGSYSDICELDHLGCVGMNFGTCYYEQHTVSCHCYVGDLLYQLRKFVGFFRKHEAKAMPIVAKKKVRKAKYSSYANRASYGVTERELESWYDDYRKTAKASDYDIEWAWRRGQDEDTAEEWSSFGIHRLDDESFESQHGNR